MEAPGRAVRSPAVRPALSECGSHNRMRPPARDRVGRPLSRTGRVFLGRAGVLLLVKDRGAPQRARTFAITYLRERPHEPHHDYAAAELRGRPPGPGRIGQTLLHR